MFSDLFVEILFVYIYMGFVWLSGNCACDFCFRKVGKGGKEIGEFRDIILEKDDF